MATLPSLLTSTCRLLTMSSLLAPKKKPIFIQVPFIGDKQASFFRRAVRQCFRLYLASEPVMVFKTRRIPQVSPKDRLSAQLQQQVIYSFVCTYGCKYASRTERRLEDRIREHVPLWLANGLKCPPRLPHFPSSAITHHLHTPVHLRWFAPVLKFHFRFSPDLCSQKEHVLSLFLP